MEYLFWATPEEVPHIIAGGTGVLRIPGSGSFVAAMLQIDVTGNR